MIHFDIHKVFENEVLCGNDEEIIMDILKHLDGLTVAHAKHLLKMIEADLDYCIEV